MRSCPILFVALTLQLVTTSHAFAQDTNPPVARLPREGATTYTAYFTSHIVAKQALGTIDNSSIREVLGVTRNTDGKPYFEGMSVRCLLYVQTVSGKVSGQGNCVEIDTDGDKVFSTFDYTVKQHTLIGGTGKYEGITGNASFIFKAIQAPGADEGAAIVDHKLSWRFNK